MITRISREANSRLYKACLLYTSHGLGVYVDVHENEIQTIVNGHYNKLPKARLATVKENAALGILFHHPVYQEFKKRPEAFTFLGNVNAYVDDIMSMLDIK